MSDFDSGRIGGQNEAYRKGLVFGLTLAEVGLLLIFVLLLLIAFGSIERSKAERAAQTSQRLLESKLAVASGATEISEVVANELGLGPNPRPEDVRNLVRVVKALNGASAETALADAKAEIDNLRRTKDELAKLLKDSGQADAEKIASLLGEQESQLQIKEGQLRRYETKLSEQGLGKGERPCWVKPDGTIEFLYDVVLASGGIKMREIPHPEWLTERAELPMPQVHEDVILNPGEFLKLTAPLYDASLAKNCRFFVVIYDGTEAQEKARYKSLLRTVEGHFYKRLDDAAPPF